MGRRGLRRGRAPAPLGRRQQRLHLPKLPQQRLALAQQAVHELVAHQQIDLALNHWIFLEVERARRALLLLQP
eukprot:90784-Chlamydomonas_euryale.AAC.3